MPFCLSKCQKVRLDSSTFFQECWMKDNSTLDSLQLSIDDPSFLYSEAESIMASAVLTFQSIGGAILNFILIVALLRNAGLRKGYLTPIIISIAVSDFLQSVYTLPILSLHYLIKDMPVNYDCQMFTFIGMVLWFCSAWNLLAVSVLRCLAVYFPMKCDSKRFRCLSKLFPILVWVIPIAYYMPALMGKAGQFGLECKTLRCRYINIDSDGNTILKTDLDSLIKLIIMAMGMMILILNIATFVQLYKKSEKALETVEDQNSEMAKRIVEQEKSLGMTMAIISILFFLVFCPTYVLHRIDENAHLTKTTASTICFLLNLSTGVLDPLVFITCQEDYRIEINAIIDSLSKCIKKKRKGPFPKMHKIVRKPNNSITLETVSCENNM